MAQGNGDSGFYEESKFLISNKIADEQDTLSAFSRTMLREKLHVLQSTRVTDSDLLTDKIAKDSQKHSAEDIQNMRNSGKYSSVVSFENGGFFAVEKSKRRRKPDEIEAARLLAKRGIQLTLKDESGNATTEDGNIVNIGTYEQKTPKYKDEYKNRVERINHKMIMRNALGHARDKNADIAVVYLKNIKMSRKQMQKGIRAFESGYKDEQGNKRNGSNYRFKYIIVVSQNGKIDTFIHKN